MSALEHARPLLAQLEALQKDRQRCGSTATRTSITVQRRHEPAGRTVRTPFGLGEVVGVYPAPGGGYTVVCYVDLARAIGVLRGALGGAA